MSTKIQIIEESKAAWDLVKYKVESVADKDLQFLAYCPSIEEAMGVFLLNRPDILITDLKLLHSYDLDLIEKLFQQNIINPRLLILATPGQLEGIQRVVEIGISALVMKPLNTDNLSRAVQRVLELVNKDRRTRETDHFITFRANRSALYLNQQDIVFIESNRNICMVTTRDGNCRTVNESISSIDQRLALKELMRVDKSTILNLSRIVYLGSDKYSKECRLKLDNGTEISKPLSKIAMSRLYKVVADKVKEKGQSVVS